MCRMDAHIQYMKYVVSGLKMETVQIRLTRNMLTGLDELIKLGEYPNRSEAVRDSVRKMLDRNKSSEVLNVSVKDLQRFIKNASK